MVQSTEYRVQTTVWYVQVVKLLSHPEFLVHLGPQTDWTVDAVTGMRTCTTGRYQVLATGVLPHQVARGQTVESTGFSEVASAILLRTSICMNTVLVVIVNGYEMKPITPR